MKSTKNSSGTKSAKGAKGCSNTSAKKSNCSGAKSSCGRAKTSRNSSQEEDSDPYGSYTGNPVGWGKYAEPVQDADDL